MHLQNKPRLSDSYGEEGGVTKEEEQIQDMPIQVFDHLRNWLKTNGLEGYLWITNAEPHPHAAEIVKQIDVDKLMNKQVHQFLNLKNEGYDIIDTFEADILESFFGEYSSFAKEYQTHGGKDMFFHDVAIFCWKCLV
mgnify:FL=1